MQFRLPIVALLLLSVLAPLTTAQTRPMRVAGEIVSLEGSTLRMRTASGELRSIAVAENLRVTKRVPIGLDDLRPGLFLGTTAAPSADGTLIASEVHVFPEASRGTGEGHYPLAGDARNTMTNATVKDVKSAWSTTATVASVAPASGAIRLTMVYQGGEKTIVVPPNVPVVRSEPADRSALTPGEHVVAYVVMGPSESLIAERISIGVNGSVPPL